MLTDIRYALRMLLKSPGFSIIAILTLALGIGANSAIFSVINTVLLQPLPFSKPNELAMLWSAPNNDQARESNCFPDYQDFREQAKSFAMLCAYTQASTVLNDGGEARELRGVAATSDIFAVLRVAPMLGRAYTRAEDNPDSRVVIFTYEAWQRYFNADPNILGRQVRLALRPYTVIGVMPRGFRFPLDGRSEYLMPVHPLVQTAVHNRGSHFFRAIGRLQPGVTVGQARAEAVAIAAHLQKQYPDTNTDRSATVVSFHQDLVGDVRPALLIVVTAVFFVLLIACANVAPSRRAPISSSLRASRARSARNSTGRTHEQLRLTGRYVVVPDKGLDKGTVFRFGAARGKLVPCDPPISATARYRATSRSASAPCACVVNEADSTVNAYHWDTARGVLGSTREYRRRQARATISSPLRRNSDPPSGSSSCRQPRAQQASRSSRSMRRRARSNVNRNRLQGKKPRFFGPDPDWNTSAAAAEGQPPSVRVLSVNHPDRKARRPGRSSSKGAVVHRFQDALRDCHREEPARATWHHSAATSAGERTEETRFPSMARDPRLAQSFSPRNDNCEVIPHPPQPSNYPTKPIRVYADDVDLRSGWKSGAAHWRDQLYPAAVVFPPDFGFDAHFGQMRFGDSKKAMPAAA